jgi:hypothetical protein
MPIGVIASITAHVALFGLFVLVMLTSHKPYEPLNTKPVIVDLISPSELASKTGEKSETGEKSQAGEKSQTADKAAEKTADNKQSQPAEKKPEQPAEKKQGQPAENKQEKPAEKPQQAAGAMAPTPAPTAKLDPAPQPQPPPEPPQRIVPDQPPIAPPKPVEIPTPQQTEADAKDQPKPKEAEKAQQTPEELEKEREEAAFRLAKQFGAILVIPDPPVGGPPKKGTEKFSKPELAALKAHIDKCWSSPPGISSGEKLMVTMRISLSRKGTLTADPSLIQASASRHGPALVKSVEQALKSCQPFSMLPAKKYKDWKTLDLNFSPRGLTSG